MPYRRLPNTDNARLKALQSALTKGKELPPFKLAYSQGTLHQIHSLLPSYETAISEQRNSYSIQVEKNKNYHKAIKKARVYIAHFIQVINMAISRGELPAETRVYFQLEDYDKKLPDLNTEESILEWADILIDGERKRSMKGLSPITNPTIAVVKVHAEKFREAYNFQLGIKRRNCNAQQKLAEKRQSADQVIQRLWNEVEDTFSDLPENLKREKSADYGIVYVYRKNEISRLNFENHPNLGIG